MRRLGEDQLLHRQRHRLGRAGEEEDRPGAGQAGGGAAEHRRRSHLLVGEHPEELAEPLDRLVEERPHRVQGDVARREARAAGRHHHVHLRVRQHPAHGVADRGHVIPNESRIHDPMAGGGDPLADGVAAGVVPLFPGVAHCKDGEAQG